MSDTIPVSINYFRLFDPFYLSHDDLEGTY